MFHNDEKQHHHHNADEENDENGHGIVFALICIALIMRVYLF